MLGWIVLGVVVLLLLYIRFAPSDPKRWHKDIKGEADKNFKGGALRCVECDLHKLDQIIRDSGARVLAGSVEEGHITYISRTRLIGFPDYTTVQLRGDIIGIYGRLRFGRSDLAVNRARIEGWLAQL